MTHDPERPDGAETPEQTFLATASHEIRTPLNGILGTVSLLLETELSPAQREYAETIRLSGGRLLDLLNNVLDYARLDASAVEVEAENFCPVRLCGEVVELLSPRAHAAGLDLAVRSLPSPMPGFLGDAGRIRQILFNLVGNALKFTPRGAVLIDAEVVTGGLAFHIRDTGPGIAPDDQARLFEAFRQTGAGDAYRDGGVGLGLAIVKRLTDLLGGRIDVVSALGEGASFSVFLPLQQSGAPPADAVAFIGGRVGLAGLPPATALSLSAGLQAMGASVLQMDVASGQIPDGIDVLLVGADLPEGAVAAMARQATSLVVLRPEDRGAIARFRALGCVGWLVRPLRMSSVAERIQLARSGGDAADEQELAAGAGRVLIADDNPVNALIARRALESAGFTVTVAATGSEALEAAARMEPNLVLMDLRMPVMDGFEAMRRLRAGGFSPPIIAVSAEINPDIERRARAAGADGVAAKPLDAEALRRLALRWTGRSGAVAGAA
ncbi:sensor histidine kinase/response regulator [Hyphomonas neptunium ATCC 15444]|uniref:histidine kinase n=2 Tax=Hyphomonas TaxID=85 RepID=Q0C5G9_HYPNA|nr:MULTISPECIES: ATP-binding protein [Hyphomonas]ABI77762.1 sensor histidine kinase/response regulator [Hyphomonas neptunium ATCC 15444]KCZ95458.1 sensor histidine kinase/response regulator [Hyphomonas hirschiana VP5]